MINAKAINEWNLRNRRARIAYEIVKANAAGQNHGRAIRHLWAMLHTYDRALR